MSDETITLLRAALDLLESDELHATHDITGRLAKIAHDLRGSFDPIAIEQAMRVDSVRADIAHAGRLATPPREAEGVSEVLGRFLSAYRARRAAEARDAEDHEFDDFTHCDSCAKIADTQAEEWAAWSAYEAAALRARPEATRDDVIDWHELFNDLVACMVGALGLEGDAAEDAQNWPFENLTMFANEMANRLRAIESPEPASAGATPTTDALLIALASWLTYWKSQMPDAASDALTDILTKAGSR